MTHMSTTEAGSAANTVGAVFIGKQSLGYKYLFQK